MPEKSLHESWCLPQDFHDVCPPSPVTLHCLHPCPPKFSHKQMSLVEEATSLVTGTIRNADVIGVIRLTLKMCNAASLPVDARGRGFVTLRQEEEWSVSQRGQALTSTLPSTKKSLSTSRQTVLTLTNYSLNNCH